MSAGLGKFLSLTDGCKCLFRFQQITVSLQTCFYSSVSGTLPQTLSLSAAVTNHGAEKLLTELRIKEKTPPFEVILYSET